MFENQDLKFTNTLEPLHHNGNSIEVAVGRGSTVSRSFKAQSSNSYAQLQVESALYFTVIRQFCSLVVCVVERNYIQISRMDLLSSG